MAARIAIVTPTYPPYRGGIGKVAAQDAAQLRALGYDVDVYVPAKDSGDGTVALRESVRYGKAAFVPGVTKVLRKYDLILLHYPFFGGAEPLACAKRLFGGGKLVVVYHMDVVGKGPLKRLFSAHTALCMPRILRIADAVIVTSLDYAEHGNAKRSFDRYREKFHALPPSVDSARFSPGTKPKELLERYGIGTDEQVILFVGGLDAAHYFKGIPSLLSALTASELMKARLVIVGDGDRRAGFERIAKDLGIDRRVTFAGSVSEDALPSHYRLADVFALPSVDKSEAFGIAALEALSSGIPVVASDLAGVRTIVRDGVTGRTVRPGSVSALIGAIKGLLEDEGTRKAYGRNARQMVEEGYTDAERQQRLGDILKDVS